MKKIFTLIATACMALAANAQNLIVFDNDATYIDEQSFTQGDVTLTLSKDIKNATKWNKKVYAVKEGENLAPFNQAINSENDVLYISGGNNPKDGEDGSGAGYTEENANLPKSGTYYKVTATKNGTILIGIVLNENKPFYVCKESDGSALGVDELTMKNAAGTVQTLTDRKLSEKFFGTVEFSAVANETYYVFCTGSKLGCFGVQLITDPDTNVNSIKSSEEGNVKAYDLGGRVASKGLLIQKGKKYVR